MYIHTVGWIIYKDKNFEGFEDVNRTSKYLSISLKLQVKNVVLEILEMQG